MEYMLTRLEWLVGPNKIQTLRDTSIALFGVGGVGGGAYGFVKYTLGTSKFAWHGGKHSDDTITNARARMLDKVKRSPMMIGKSYEEFWAVVPYDALP